VYVLLALLVRLLVVLLGLLLLLLLLLFRQLTVLLALLLLLLLLQAEATAIFPDRQLVEARSVDGVKFYIGYNKLAICTGSQVTTQGFITEKCTAMHSSVVICFLHCLCFQPCYFLAFDAASDTLLCLLLLLLPCLLLHCQGSTFGIPGVEQHAHFLRDVRHAEAIRSQLIENIALAGVPGQQIEVVTLVTFAFYCTASR
jgi:hypothetical protein